MIKRKSIMNKDVTNVIKDGTSTFWNIAQMAHYRVRYAQEKDSESEAKMYKHALLSVAGIASLLTIGIVGLIDSRKSTYPVF